MIIIKSCTRAEAATIIAEHDPARAEQRAEDYSGGGDWWFDKDGNLIVLCIDMQDPVRNDDVFLLALHEVFEAKLCQKEGVTEDAVVSFDLAHNAGASFDIPYDVDGQPGDHPASPYRTQHRRAAVVEHVAALFLGITDYGTVD